MGAAASDYFTPYADVQYGFLDEELGILNFHALAAKGDYHRVSICLKKGLDPNRPAFDDDDDYAREDTPMICAARGVPLLRGRKRHLKTLELLLHFGGDVNKHNYLEQTPLYVACEKNLVAIAQWLLTHGADANKNTKVGVSPLLCAYRNDNADLVKMLLDHGAHAIDPPREFCCVQFPTMTRELRGENTDQPHDSDDDDTQRSRGDDETDARPTSSRFRLRPLWKSRGNEKPEIPDNRPTSTQRARTAPKKSTDREQMRKDIEAQQRRQQQQRGAILSDLEEKQRIAEQREYRERLAVDNAQRKAKRRLQREKTNYDKYVARVEEKRREHLAPLQGARSMTHLQGDSRPSTSAGVTVGLRWSTQPPEILRRSINTAPSRVGRPTWSAQEVFTTQVASSGESRRAGDDQLIKECQFLDNTLRLSREQHERLRSQYTTTEVPAALPPLDRDRHPWVSLRPETAS